MSCDCVSEGIAVLKDSNKRLRMINKKLRDQLYVSRVWNDEMFEALCATTSTEAQDAMETLWDAGGLECEPEDYQLIVEHYLGASTQTSSDR